MVSVVKKNRIRLVVLLALIFVALLAWSPQHAEKLNALADSLFRQPGDPAYLSLHYRLRTLLFSVIASPARPIVFLGDSITYGGDWRSLFPGLPVENRGIGGDSTLGLLSRLNQVITLRPSQIFLMIGTNDLCYGRDISGIIANYRVILGRLRAEVPGTKVYIQSVLPFNDKIFPSRGLRSNRHIYALNRELKILAEEYRYPYVDLASVFSGEEGRLPTKFTNDGLHLSEIAYAAWRDQIKDLVVSANSHSY